METLKNVDGKVIVKSIGYLSEDVTGDNGLHLSAYKYDETKKIYYANATTSTVHIYRELSDIVDYLTYHKVDFTVDKVFSVIVKT